ncbi:sugar phosphate isomerase/epimerase [Paenibacillus sp. YYML68]|uniref:sugar phosphate isomerase/epimerase family protein n=1 Tax=Paenibacillus sp. YYML68 TaxID=2909250 RepID=UPI002492BFAC|nr:sugar phosphate isomerase/epimerase family protein [Paenibacillus sp. YYML68]
MWRGLTRAGLGDVGTDIQWMELAAEYGFESVDLDAGALADPHRVLELREAMERLGLMSGAFGLPVEWRRSEEAFREGLPQLAAAAAGAAKLGLTRCCTYVLPSTDEKAAHFMAVATRRLRQCAVILSSYGIRLGLEFVGPHHLRTQWANPFIWTMDETLDWIEAIGERHVGLLFDTYHAYTTGLTGQDLDKLSAEHIVHVHINDAPDVPVEAVRDNERLYTGEGVVDLADYLRGLKRIGYNGPIAQEVLLKTAPASSPRELLARTKAGFDRVFAEAGIR